MRRRNKKLLLGTMMAVVTLGLGGVTFTAFADDQPPSDDVLFGQCQKDPTACTFHPQEFWQDTAPEQPVGDAAFNCSAQDQQLQITWSQTTGTSTNVEASVSVGASLFKIVDVSASVTFGHTWEDSKTFG